MLNVFILVVTFLTGAVLLHPRLANAPLWRATITPLASIIGSGFLVIGPILHTSFGALSPLVMMALCGLAYLFGFAIRYNITTIDDGAARSRTERDLDQLASWALAFAYVVSVAYYLNLFGAFGLSLTDMNDAYHVRLLASGALLVILWVGWLYGFSALERMEQVTVGIKLAIIAGLLVGLGWYFFDTTLTKGVVIELPKMQAVTSITLVFGLVVTVQGFETSRYLGDTYSAQIRIRSMRLAQAISAAIYLIYIIFLTYSFEQDAIRLDETAIIDMMGLVAPILSVLLVAAALSAQFSAAVADAGGSGGLISELTHGRVGTRYAYAILVGVGLVLTWTSNVFEIISYASRAFAFYYGLQAAVAAIAAYRQGAGFKVALFCALALTGAAMTVFGAPVE